MNNSTATGVTAGGAGDAAVKASKINDVAQPGTVIRPGLVLPLNLDPFTMATVAGLNGPVFQNFAGTLNAHGTASALFDTQIPVPSVLAGSTIHFAYAVSLSLTHASEASALSLTP